MVAVGPGETHPDTGKLLASPVGEGDYVLMAEYSGEKIDYCGEQHMFVDGSSILGESGAAAAVVARSRGKPLPASTRDPAAGGFRRWTSHPHHRMARRNGGRGERLGEVRHADLTRTPSC